MEAKHRRRLLASDLLPSGIYGAEHAPWTEVEVQWLANEAVRVAGLNVMGVPLHVLRLLLPADASPEWKVWWSALERWAREVWIAARREPGGFPQDTLLVGELEWAGAVAQSPAPCHGERSHIGLSTPVPPPPRPSPAPLPF